MFKCYVFTHDAGLCVFFNKVTKLRQINFIIKTLKYVLIHVVNCITQRSVSELHRSWIICLFTKPGYCLEFPRIPQEIASLEKSGDSFKPQIQITLWQLYHSVCSIIPQGTIGVWAFVFLYAPLFLLNFKVFFKLYYYSASSHNISSMVVPRRCYRIFADFYEHPGRHKFCYLTFWF